MQMEPGRASPCITALHNLAAFPKARASLNTWMTGQSLASEPPSSPHLEDAYLPLQADRSVLDERPWKDGLMVAFPVIMYKSSFRLSFLVLHLSVPF